MKSKLLDIRLVVLTLCATGLTGCNYMPMQELHIENCKDYVAFINAAMKAYPDEPDIQAWEYKYNYKECMADIESWNSRWFN